MSILFLCATVVLARQGGAKVDCLTFHYNNARLGWDDREQILTPAALTQGGFGKLWTQPLDGAVRHSPLVVSNCKIEGQIRDVVFAGTDENSLFAVDAKSGQVLWSKKQIFRPLNGTQFSGSSFDDRQLGILGTPVIDRETQTIYACCPRSKGLSQQYIVVALDLSSGEMKPGFPHVLRGQDKGATFNAGAELQRGALSLVNGWLLVPFGGRGDNPPWRGWLLGLNTRNLNETSAFCASPKTDGGGLWSGGGVSSTADGTVFAATGNGTFDLNTGGLNASESVLQLKMAQKSLLSASYTPKNYAFLDEQDEDLGGATPNLLPPQPGTIPNLMFTGGKDGCAYLLNRDHLGGIGGELQRQRYFCPEKATYHEGIRSTSCYLDAGANGKMVIVAGDEEGPSGSKGVAALSLEVDPKLGYVQFKQRWTIARQLIYPSSPIVTSYQGSGGVVWVVETGQNPGSNDQPASLHAYNALTGEELIDTAKIKGANFMSGKRFTAPTAANGMVFVPSTGLIAFGFKAQP